MTRKEGYYWAKMDTLTGPEWMVVKIDHDGTIWVPGDEQFFTSEDAFIVIQNEPLTPPED